MVRNSNNHNTLVFGVKPPHGSPFHEYHPGRENNNHTRQYAHTSGQLGLFRKTGTQDRPSCDFQRAGDRATSKTDFRGLWLVNTGSSPTMAISPVYNWADERGWKLAENPAQSGPRLVSKLEILSPAVKLWLFQIESRFFNLHSQLGDAN